VAVGKDCRVVALAKGRGEGRKGGREEGTERRREREREVHGIMAKW
jgi:hypothetical protein